MEKTYSEDYLAGFKEAQTKARNIVQKAREGESDGDFRSLLWGIDDMKPGVDTEEDEL